MSFHKPSKRHYRQSATLIEPLEVRRLLSAGNLDYTFGTNGMAKLALGNTSFDTRDVAVQFDGKVVVVGATHVDNAGRVWGVARYNEDGTLDTTFGGDGVVETPTLDGHHSLIASAVVIQSDGKIVVGGNAFDESGQFVTNYRLGLARYNADGTLDTEFDGDGTTTYDVDSESHSDELIQSLAIQHDGGIVFGGSALTYGGIFDATGNFDMIIGRYNLDGTLDGSFGDGGVKDVGFGADEGAHAIAIDYSGTASTNPNYGKIVAVGFNRYTNSVPQTITQFAFIRLTTGGDLDDTFAGDGRLAVPFGNGYVFSQAEGVVIQPDGKIVIAGTIRATADSDSNFGLMRLNPNGSGDPTFGPSNGQIAIDFGSSTTTQDIVGDLIIGQTGKLLVGGSSAPGFTHASMAIACLNADGTLDSLFGGAGKRTISFYGEDVSAAGLALAPRGKFVAAGGNNADTARLYDRGATVAVTSLDSISSETGPDQASFFVTRVEHLPYPTRVYFARGGTATPPGVYGDYIPDGITLGRLGNWVDIPANEVYAAVTLTPVDDPLIEPTETAAFSIIDEPGTIDVWTPRSVNIEIRDNDHQISGTVFDDFNADAAQGGFEQGLTDWTVYLDTNNSNTLDSGEPRTTTDAGGRYAFGGLANGTYYVREVLPTGWRRTLPTANAYTVALTTGTVVEGQDFGNTQSARISGQVFRDADGDGVKDTNEGGLEGIRVYIDGYQESYYNNDVFDSGEYNTFTDASGNYVLNVPVFGSTPLEVRVEPTNSYAQTLPVSQGSYNLTLAEAQVTTGKTFGLKPLVIARPVTSIRGSIFNDIDGDGVRDVQNPTEPDLVGWTAYLDLNKNNKLDSGEPTRTTDEAGNFVFEDLTPGVSYRVRQVVPKFWKQTTHNPADITLGDSQVAVVIFGDRPIVATFDGVGNLLVNGTAGPDTIRVVSASGGKVKVFLNNESSDALTVSGKLIINALGGNDTVDIASNVMLDAIVYGGSGDDTITGGGGTNLLLGQDGNDALAGGAKRDILVGGNGADNLTGGGGDDLLIAGTTAYDEDPSSLAAIQAEWLSANAYADRVMHLQDGTGLTAGRPLDATTVLDDAASDVLTGGTGQDLFYFNFDSGVLDTLTDKAGNETALDID